MGARPGGGRPAVGIGPAAGTGDYRLSLLGVPCRWRTRIECWEPGRRFVDVQLQGPYRLWRHAHDFVSVEGGTIVRDAVAYQLPFGPLGRLGHALLVRRQLDAIFDHRQRRIAALLDPRTAHYG